MLVLYNRERTPCGPRHRGHVSRGSNADCPTRKTQDGAWTEIPGDGSIATGICFFQAECSTEPYAKFPREHVLRLLTTGENRQWQLAGEDEKFAAWLFQCDGLLGFSKAYKERDKIRIVSGPLKDLEGQILRIDRRGRSGQVVLEFNGRQVKVWLGFELIDAVNDQTQIMLPGESGSPDRHDVPEGTDEDNQEARVS